MKRNLSDPDLWQKLESFQLDRSEAELPFSKRLARDNKWNHPFALQVLDEYKRFLYLTVVSGHPVTPSEEVDAAWHLHLCYTRSYWEQLCGNVLERKLHHKPTQGGSAQSDLFRKQYLQTLESYQSEFGEKPPSSIWPDVEERFQPIESHSTQQDIYQIRVPKNWVHATLVGTVLALVAAGCA